MGSFQGRRFRTHASLALVISHLRGVLEGLHPILDWDDRLLVHSELECA
jgi:hypothetical protein